MLPQHILVPVDFSDISQQALDFAIELAQPLNARLLLLHVIEPLVFAGGHGGMGTGAANAEVIKQIEVDATQNLENYVEHGRKSGLACTGEVLHGTPFEQITEVANHKQVGLIIMGTRGRTGIKHFFLGSVAENVVRMADCPVLVVPGNTSEDVG